MLNILSREPATKGKEAPRPAFLDAPRALEHIIREGRMMIGPELAKRILAETNYVGQRGYDERTGQVYAAMMQRGLWDLADPITFASLAGKLILVNGQHRLQAIILFGKPVEFRVAINHVASEADAKALYWRFDKLVRGRSDADVLRAADVAAEHEVSPRMARAVYAATGIIVNGFVIPASGTIKDIAKLRIVDLRIEACAPFWPAARTLEAALKKCESQLRGPILRATTFSVALITTKYQEEKAAEFWKGVAENDGLRRRDPRHAFVRDLKNRKGGIGQKDQTIHAAALAWNAWFEGRNLELVKVPENAKLRILGTPIGARG